jgi:hypothetical protein
MTGALWSLVLSRKRFKIDISVGAVNPVTKVLLMAIAVITFIFAACKEIFALLNRIPFLAIQIEWKTCVMAAKARLYICSLQELLQLLNTEEIFVQSKLFSNIVPNQFHSCAAKEQLRNK